MTPVYRSSATQVELHNRCPAAWWYRYVAKEPDVKGRGATLGDAAHQAVEALRNGEPLPALSPEALAFDISEAEVERLARAAIAEDEAKTRVKWPEVDVCPGDWENECGFELPTYPGGPVFVGFIDRSWWPVDGVAEGAAKAIVAVVLDYKFRGDSRYALVAADVAASTQMTAYAVNALQRQGFWDVDEAIVGLGHINVLTRGKPRAWLVSTEVAAPTVRSRWAKILETVREAEHTRLIEDEGALERRGLKNGQCEAFGGCPFRERCEAGAVSADEAEVYSMATVAEAIARKKAEREAKAAAEAAAANGNAPAKAANGTVMVTGAVAEAVIGEQLPVGAGVITTPERAAEAEARTSRLVPPDGGPRTQPDETLSVPPKSTAAELPEELAHLAPAHAQIDPVGTPPVEPPKSGRRGGRRPGGVTAAAAGAEFALARGEAGAEPVRGGCTLYVDCTPVKGVSFELGEDWLAGPKAAAAREANVADFRLIEFGKGKGYLADVVRAKALAGLPEALVITSMHAGSDVLLDELVPMAAVVVRGMRG